MDNVCRLVALLASSCRLCTAYHLQHFAFTFNVGYRVPIEAAHCATEARRKSVPRYTCDAICMDGCNCAAAGSALLRDAEHGKKWEADTCANEDQLAKKLESLFDHALQ